MTTQVRNPFAGGPYVQIAGFCERILREADGVLSLIRMVDVVTHTENRPDAPEEMPAFHYPLTLVLTLKSGEARGRHDISITPVQPGGESLGTITASIRLEGEGRGANIVSPIDLPYTQEGLYWFDIHLGQDILTRIPLEVRYSRLVTGQTSQS